MYGKAVAVPFRIFSKTKCNFNTAARILPRRSRFQQNVLVNFQMSQEPGCQISQPRFFAERMCVLTPTFRDYATIAAKKPDAIFKRAKEMIKEGEKFIETQKYHDSVEKFEEAIAVLTDHSAEQRLSPLDFAELLYEPYFYKGYALQMHSKPEEAKASYEMAAKLMRDLRTNRKDLKYEGALGQCLVNLSEITAMAGDIEQAITINIEAQSSMRAAFGENSELYAASLSNLGCYQGAIGNIEEAERSFATSHRIFKKTLGQNNPYTVNAARHLLKTFTDLGKQAEMEKLSKEYQNLGHKLEIEPEREPTEEELKEFEEAARAMPNKKALDPEGASFGAEWAKGEITEFFEKWKKEGLPVGPELLDSLSKETKNWEEEYKSFKDEDFEIKKEDVVQTIQNYLKENAVFPDIAQEQNADTEASNSAQETNIENTIKNTQ